MSQTWNREDVDFAIQAIKQDFMEKELIFRDKDCWGEIKKPFFRSSRNQRIARLACMKAFGDKAFEVEDLIYSVLTLYYDKHELENEKIIDILNILGFYVKDKTEDN